MSADIPKRRIQIPMVFASVVFLMTGCVNGGGAPAPKEPETISDSGGGPKFETKRALGTPVKKSRKEPVKKAETEMYFDFVERISQAHLYSGGLLVDFGSSSRNKYTLGDWKSGWRGNYEIDDTTFSYLSGNTGRVFFSTPSNMETVGGRITVRAKGIGSTHGRIYLNGKQLGTGEFSKESFGHSTVEFASGLLKDTNELLFRFNTRKAGHDGRRASLAIDYVRITPETQGEGPSAAAVNVVSLPSATGGKPGIVLSSGESLTYYVKIPKKGALRGEIVSRVPGVEAGVEVRVLDDSGENKVVFSSKVKDRTTRLDAHLDAYAGRAVAINIAVTTGEVRFGKTGIVGPLRKGEKAPGKLSAKNVVLVLIDTLRADHLQMYNPDTRVRADYLGRLAEESMVFEHALAQENWTKPSITTLLTGLYPESHNTKTEKHRVPGTVTLASEHFKRLGYTTAGFVANGYISAKFGFRRDWDKWRNYVREGKPNRAQFVVDDSVEWLHTRPNKDDPFFLYVHTIDPHVPYIPPSKYRALYDDEPYNGLVQPRGTAKLLEKVKTGAVKLSNRDKFRLEALYDGEITYHDDHLKRLHDELEAQGLLENTVIVVTADHGEEFFEHGSVGHGHSMYEELLHVPLIFRLPGAEAKGGARCSAEVGLVDVLPTLCEILGVECPEGLEGRSLVDLLRGASGDEWPEVEFSDFLDGQRVARAGRYKLIYRGMSTTLFDLATDPNETGDLSDSMPVTLAFMRELLGEHQGRFVQSSVVHRESPKKTHKKEEVKIDSETRKQLEALGYFEE